jgi:hypothetical protein
MEPQVHELKVWPEFFARLIDGTKMFEIRKDDRGFRVRDTLVLREWSPRMKKYTGREMRRLVSYVMGGPGFGLMPGYVVMGLAVRLDERCEHCHVPSWVTEPCERWKEPVDRDGSNDCEECGYCVQHHSAGEGN